MLFLVLPKEWHHDHADHAEKHVKHENKMDESCFTCDFDLAHLNATISIPQNLYIVKHSQSYSPITKSYAYDVVIDQKGRAPPSLT